MPATSCTGADHPLTTTLEPVDGDALMDAFGAAAGASWSDLVRKHRDAIVAEVTLATAGGEPIDEPRLLRLVLARLVAHEEDPSRLATTAASVANAIVRADSASRSMLDDARKEIPGAIREILIEIVAARKAAEAARSDLAPKGAQP